MLREMDEQGAGAAWDLASFDSELQSRISVADWESVKAFRDRPTFLNALESYARLFSPFYSDHLLLNKVVTEGRRFEMLVYLLYLYQTTVRGDPLSGLTIANFKRVCAAQNVCSPNRALAIISIMRLARFLQRDQAHADARVKRLAPTPRFMDIVEAWNRTLLIVIDAAAPEAQLARAHAEHPAMGAKMRVKAAQHMLGGWHLLDFFPEARHFIDRDGGWMLLLHCTDEALRLGKRRAIAPVAVDLGHFGRRFGVSRSHVRRILEEAHEKGLLTAPPQNGKHIALSPILVASYLTCMAYELSFSWGIAREALAEFTL